MDTQNDLTSRFRRHLTALCVLATLATPATAQTRMRLLAGNLTSEHNQSYVVHGIRILKGLRPDVALLQEYRFGRNTPADMKRFVTEAFGPEFHAHGRLASEDGAIPNGIVSRWPIIAGGEWRDPEIGNRDFTWARIDIPGPRDLWAVSVHLKAGGESNRREAEARALVEEIRKAVPADGYLAIGGDFNTANRNEACLVRLGGVVKVGAPFPSDQHGNGNTNTSRSKPYDWVLVDPRLDALEVPVVIPGRPEFRDGLVFDSRTFSPLGAVQPVESGDSQAEGMQHMAVVRDFQLP